MMSTNGKFIMATWCEPSGCPVMSCDVMWYAVFSSLVFVLHCSALSCRIVFFSDTSLSIGYPKIKIQRYTKKQKNKSVSHQNNKMKDEQSYLIINENI